MPRTIRAAITGGIAGGALAIVLSVLGSVAPGQAGASQPGGRVTADPPVTRVCDPHCKNTSDFIWQVG